MSAVLAHPSGPSAEQLVARRARLLERLPSEALVLVPGARPNPEMRRFRQNNDFWYLSAVEAAGAYLLMDCASQKQTLYLRHREPERERSDGPSLSFEDAEELCERTGIESVAPLQRLTADIGWALVRRPRPIYMPLAPEETSRVTRDSALSALAWAASDPFAADSASVGDRVRRTFSQAEIRDLSPILDRLRLIKDDQEIEALRAAARLCGNAVVEAMRSTAPGVFEYELEAVADFVYRQGGARGGGYEAIIAGGRNAWYGHYNANDAELRAGDLLLMDYAPDVAYYTSDIGRMWPVNGIYTDAQRELYGFVLAYHSELISRIRPGAVPSTILEEAAAAMRERLRESPVSGAAYRAAFEGALSFAGHLSHPVGMAVHDVGDYRAEPLEPGLVFSVDPMIWVPEEQLYVRVEDTVLVTVSGVENLTGFVPLEMDEVEQEMKRPGLLQLWEGRE